MYAWKRPDFRSDETRLGTPLWNRGDSGYKNIHQKAKLNADDGTDTFSPTLIHQSPRQLNVGLVVSHKPHIESLNLNNGELRGDEADN